jgi:hypothetical protein
MVKSVKPYAVRSIVGPLGWKATHYAKRKRLAEKERATICFHTVTTSMHAQKHRYWVIMMVSYICFHFKLNADHATKCRTPKATTNLEGSAFSSHSS